MPNGFESIRSSLEHSIIIEFVILTTNVVLNFIAANFNGLVGFLNRMTDTIISVIASNNAALAKTVKSVVGIAEKNILDGILDVDATVVRAERNILSEVAVNTDLLGIVVGALHDGINVEISNSIEVTDSLFGTLLKSVKSILDGNVSGIGGIVKTISDQFGGIFDGLITVLGGTLLDQVEVLEKIWNAIFKGVAKQAEVSDVVLDETNEGVGAITVQSVISKIEPGVAVSAKQLRSAFVDWTNVQDNLACLDDDTRDLIEGGTNADGLVGEVVDVAINSMGLVMAAFALGSARAQRAVFDYQACNPNQPLPPAETLLAFQRKLIDPGEAELNLRKQGWSAEDAELIINTGFATPDLPLIYALWLRNEVDDDAFDLLLRRLGYDDAMIVPLKKLAFFIPPVQDLITMSVREVFSPEIRARNQQDANFPPDFLKWALQQGVSEEWARNYWAAHWVLPSVQMGFEMLHRREIDEDRLRELMQALDIMPGWVDALIKISFTPITRVDIRRLNRLGFLEGVELRDAYRDIGYNPENAERLSAFTEELNKADEVFTLDVASDLSRSSIIGFYKDGIIGSVITRVLLIQAGINVAAAELFVAAADFDLERADRKQRVALILDRFKFGGLTFDEAADRLAGLGLETVELQLVRLDLERLAAQETRLPSRADLDRFVKGGIIDDVEYLDMMSRLGFSLNWSRRFLELASAA